MIMCTAYLNINPLPANTENRVSSN